jgi:hypothetical protein
MNVPYRIVIEPQEYDLYASVIDPKKILTLPFSNLEMGGIPARNWVWNHSVNEGHKRHWILDDNIDGFIRLNRNMKIRVDSGVIFKCCEDFVDRYENIPMSGMNYRYFALQTVKYAPFYLNTRIYSCILLSNEEKYKDFRWRGRYNEDTDLSIRFLKAGYCTVLFQAFLCNKRATLTMKGGNTNTVYATDDNRREFAESLQKQHPDIVKMVFRYNRWHHEVDYSHYMKFNKLIKKPDVIITKGINNYGMILKSINELDIEPDDCEFNINNETQEIEHNQSDLLLS